MCACVRVCLCVSLATAREKDDPSLWRGGGQRPPPVKMIIEWPPLAGVEAVVAARRPAARHRTPVHLAAQAQARAARTNGAETAA